MLKQEVAIGCTSNDDGAVADREDAISPFVMKTKATGDAIVVVQSSLLGLRLGMIGIPCHARDVPQAFFFLSASDVDGSRRSH